MKPSGWPRVASGPLVISLLTLSSASCKFLASYSSAFVDQNYKDEPKTPPKLVDPNKMRVRATLEPLLVSTYEEPAAVAACLRGFADPQYLEPLRKFGACLASMSPQAESGSADSATADSTCLKGADSWDHCVFSSFDLVSCSCVKDAEICDHPMRDCDVIADRMPEACAALSKTDRAHVLVSVGYAGEAMVAYDLQTQGSAIDSGEVTILERLTPERAKAFGEGFRESANTLSCDGTNGSEDCLHTVKARPTSGRKARATLALSGGAANGAFMAGYLFELLQARSYAASKDPLAKKEGFDAVVGTSVGALIAPIVELAFVDAPVSPHALDWCANQLRLHASSADSSGSDPKSATECSIALLDHYFNQISEPDLLCAEDAVFVEFVAGAFCPPDKPSLGRFWPMERDIVRPFYAEFGDVLAKNDTVRVVMTTDVESSTLQGQDERTCRFALSPRPEIKQCSNGAPGELTGCLPCGVLTSVPNPLFARPPARGYSGTDPAGEPGTYLDGGLRSGFPILRAVELSGLDAGATVPVLGISTERAETAPDVAPRTGFDMALYTIGQLVSQTHQWEVSHATLFEEKRRKRAALLYTTVNPDGAAGVECTEQFASPSATFGNVFATFMPEDLGKKHLSIAGYQFDPDVMQGFFLTGRRMFLDQARSKTRNVIAYLRWNVTDAVTHDATSGESWLDLERKRVARRWATWSKHFDVLERDWNAHLAVRRADIKARLMTCPY